MTNLSDFKTETRFSPVRCPRFCIPMCIYRLRLKDISETH
uniref:Uncharacterized protein n=1 Tax=Anguilla anguilla TaxID=7936 RepID=A0A0E9STN0_ANGAN